MDAQSEDERLRLAIQALEHWLDTFDADSPEQVGLDEEDLWRISSLLCGRATEAELFQAVCAARASGLAMGTNCVAGRNNRERSQTEV